MILFYESNRCGKKHLSERKTGDENSVVEIDLIIIFILLYLSKKDWISEDGTLHTVDSFLLNYLIQKTNNKMIFAPMIHNDHRQQFTELNQ